MGARVPAELKDRRPLVLVYQGASAIAKDEEVRSWRARDYSTYVIERRIKGSFEVYFDVWRALHPRSGPMPGRGRCRASARGPRS